uniref:Uncharacterized protein n=1 Tax=Cucumis melo TaxID=3656 RepID=A0A9I9EBF1_CUCME
MTKKAFLYLLPISSGSLRLLAAFLVDLLKSPLCLLVFVVVSACYVRRYHQQQESSTLAFCPSDDDDQPISDNASQSDGDSRTFSTLSYFYSYLKCCIMHVKKLGLLARSLIPLNLIMSLISLISKTSL